MCASAHANPESGLHTQGRAARASALQTLPEGSIQQKERPWILLSMSWENIRPILVKFTSNLPSGAVGLEPTSV